MGRPHYIAVIDDEAPVRKALARRLSAASFETAAYGSAQEFIDSLAQRTPDCAVVDVQMPDLSGLDLQRHLKKARIGLPVIMITAFDDPGVRTRCLASGAVAFLTKPLSGATLIAAIMQAMASGESGRAP
jgi:FixJ family two-component response regulator